MNNKIYLIRLRQRTGRLTCNWVPTGDKKMPLACVWTGTNASPGAAAASSSEETGTEETGKMQQCA
jgi:hypothetical protein